MNEDADEESAAGAAKEEQEEVNVCNPDTQVETLPPHVEDASTSSKAAAASAAASAATAAGDEDAALLQLSAEEIAHSHQLAQEMLALNEQSNNLRSALEGEIKGLERSASDRLDGNNLKYCF